MLVLVHQLRRRAAERHFPAQHFPERDAERIQVRADIGCDPGKLFGTSVSRCADKRSYGGKGVFLCYSFSQTQIDNFGGL